MHASWCQRASAKSFGVMEGCESLGSSGSSQPESNVLKAASYLADGADSENPLKKDTTINVERKHTSLQGLFCVFFFSFK